MSTIASGSGPTPEDAADQRSDPPLGTRTDGDLRRARWLAGLAGLVAGLAAFGIGEAAYNRIPPRKVLQNTMGTIALVVTSADQSVADVRNAALAFAVMGACLGGGLGLAGGLARRSAASALAAGLVGAVVAAGLAAGLALLTLDWFTYTRQTYGDYEMPVGMAMHGLIWGLVGAVAGLAFAGGLGRPRLLAAAALAGFLGAVFGSLVFDLVGAFQYPLDSTGDPVSTSLRSRLAARLLVAVATAGGLILVLPNRGAGKAEAPSTAAPAIAPDPATP